MPKFAYLIWLLSAASACTSTGRPMSLSAYEGAELFQSFCASCHGTRGRGDGPVAPILKVKVADLTHIAARRGGVFPRDEVYRIIDGQALNESHGDRHMPVWGYEFFGNQSDDEAAHAQAVRTIDRLVNYLEAIQLPDWAQ